MSQEKRFGLNNPKSTVQARANGSSIHLIRRQIQPNVRKRVNGFVIPKNTIVTPKLIKKPASVSLRETVSSRSVPKIKPALPRQSRSGVLSRDAIKPKSKRHIRHHVSSQLHPSRLLIVLAGVVFISGSLLGYLGWKFNRQAAASVKVLSSTKENDKSNTVSEDEITPEILSTYKVGSDMPRYLKVPRLDINSRIKVLGDPPSGTLSAPLNIFDTGWYNHSSKPGEIGTVLIDGYVHGPTKPAVFFRLGNLQVGDTIEIERGDGKIFIYSVALIEKIDRDNVDMAKLLAPIDAKKPGLNLVTYTDRYDIKTNKFEQRTIIYSVQQ